MTNEIRRLQGPDDLETWELFPSSLQEMAEWADVYKDEDKHDKSRNHTLIYKHVPEEDMTMIFLVAIRVHGILEQFRVERFGNWSGLTISNEQFNTSISRREDTKPLGMQLLHHSTLLTNIESKEPRLQPEEDPGGKFYRIQDEWNVIQPLCVAELTAEGKKLPIDAVLLTEGDFVEVGAELDFVVNRNRDTRTTVKCFLMCTYIVRMMPAREVQNRELVSGQLYTRVT
ncbi:hypothetical protein C8R48DRAFT_617897 [Suillus tomentosus]|nr:hypothetical protein C8R48DRAFT_617897 [Suillus tomentosus]